MSVKTQLKRTLYNVLTNDNKGSYATRDDRQKVLINFVEDLISLGYKLSDIRNLKTKHIVAVVTYWKQRPLDRGTLKNRLSNIRHLATLINKSELVPSNQELKIPSRKSSPIKNRAIYNPDFSRISNPEVRISLELQRVFGLRREESLKINPNLADREEKLDLQPSWCKGGRGRVIPIRTDEQRYWLERAKAITEEYSNSLIPYGKTYIEQRYIYDKQTYRAGLRNLHGLRHAYAQQRYKELTGWEAPINGGPKIKELTIEQRKIDRQARMILTEELGHSRVQILVNYCSM